MEHLLIAIVGGTIISACFAYVIVYGKDHFQSKQGLPRSFTQWKRAFDHLVNAKKSNLSANEARPAMGGNRSGADSMTQDSFKTHLKLLSSKYKEYDKEIEAKFFIDISDDIQLMREICKKRSEEFRRKWGHGISDHYLKERFIELCEQQAFIQNHNLKMALSLRGIEELWESYAGLYLFYDDARLGSSTVSKELESKLKLDPLAIYRGIEFWFISRSGQSKVSLLEGYKREHLKNSFLKSQRLLNMTKERAHGLILSLCFPAKHKVKTFPELLKECEQAALEVENFLHQSFKEENQGREQKSQFEKKQHHRPKAKKTAPRDDFHFLKIPPTDDLNKIKKAYHKQAMLFHPDRLDLKSEQEQKKAHDDYVAIQKAYERLEKKYSKRAA
jgi:DnaJ-domain-containing protein 1